MRVYILVCPDLHALLCVNWNLYTESSNLWSVSCSLTFTACNSGSTVWALAIRSWSNLIPFLHSLLHSQSDRDSPISCLGWAGSLLWAGRNSHHGLLTTCQSYEDTRPYTHHYSKEVSLSITSQYQNSPCSTCPCVGQKAIQGCPPPPIPTKSRNIHGP